MGLGEASASHGQDELGAEDVRVVLAGYGQDKQGTKMLEKFNQVMDKINRM